MVWLWSVRAKRGGEGEDCSLEINQSKEKESGKKAGKGGKKGTSIHAVAVTVAISPSFHLCKVYVLALFFLCF